MKRLSVCVAVAALAAMTAPVGAAAAVRTGSVQDPQGDASALSGPVLDIRSFAVAYDDVAGTLRMTWVYESDVRIAPPGGESVGGLATAESEVLPNRPTDTASIHWSARQEASGTWAFPATLRLYGASGALTGSSALSADGRTVVAEFTHPTLVGHDWQRVSGANLNGDEFDRFWFDGFQATPPAIPPPVASPPVVAPPPGGPVPGTPDSGSGAPESSTGMSIDGGAQFTNDPNVTLAVIAPSGVGSLRVSNDGGFLKAQPFRVASTIKWKLAESGSERLPKTVYLRFGDRAQTFTDDIILDQTKPTLTSASLVRAASTRAAEPRAASRKRTYRVRVGAKDTTSGIGSVQVAVRKSRPDKPRKFARVISLKSASAPRFVRVRDRAGNYSRWTSIR